jgi:hypothetical protein
MDKAERQMAEQAALDSLGPFRQALAKWGPWSTARSVVASLDNSFPFNQGGFVLFADPKSWSRGFVDSWKGFSESKAEGVLANMRAQTEWWDRAAASNLFEEGADLADIFGGASEIPGIKQSQRAYETGAKAMRFELFKRISEMSESAGGKPLTLEDYKAIAKEVKAVTGQGAWLKGGQSLSKPFFALRYRMSQIETAIGAPLFRTFAHGRTTGNYGPFKVMLKKYTQAYATMAATAAAAKLSLNHFGGRDENGKPLWDLEINPLSSNFGRVVHRSGKTVHTWDVMPPSMKMVGLASRVVSGQRETVMGNQQDAREFKDRGLSEKMAGEWLFNGLHPVLSNAWGVWKAQSDENKEHFGRSFDMSTAAGWGNVAKGFAPIPVQNLMDLWGNPDLSTEEKTVSSALLFLIQQQLNREREQTPEIPGLPSIPRMPRIPASPFSGR